MTLSDVRLGLRLLAKRPGQTGVAVLMLSLGIGLTTAMFSILYGTFLRGLPFEHPDRFVILDRSNPAADLPRAPVPYQDFAEWRRQQKSFEDLVAWAGFSVDVVGDGVPPSHYNGALVTVNLFDVIGVRPMLGRGFLPEDARPESPAVVIISHPIWKDLFNADPDILNRSIQVSGAPAVVVGVMPPGFEFPLKQDLWRPLRNLSGEAAAAPFLQVFGKLKTGISLRQARAEVATIAERLARERPDTHAGLGVLLSPYTYGYTDEGLRRSQQVLLAAVFAVLLIACVNAASLLLVQSTQRLNELAVRTALGASRRRLMAQLLAEAGILVFAGALLGLLVARWAIDAYLRLFGGLVFNFWMDIRLDPAAFLAAAAVSGLAVLLTGLPAALLCSRTRPVEVLKQDVRAGGSRSGRLYRALNVAEIALSFALLVVTGLTIKSVLNLGHVELGASPDKVLIGQISLAAPQYEKRPDQVRFLQALDGRIGALPGVQSAGLASDIPGQESGSAPFEIEGSDVSPGRALPETRRVVVSPGYFDVFGLKPMEGRILLQSDRRDAPATAVVNRSFARKYFPGKSPVGRRLRLGASGSDRPWLTVVGVVPDVALGGIQGKDHDGLYLPLSQNGGRWMSLVIRAEQGPLPLASPVRKAAAALDPEMVVFWVTSLEDQMAEQTLTYRAAALLFTLFGSLALFLAVVGLYGVMALAIRQKTREIGIRIALGARPRQVKSLILRDGALQIALGLLLGIALASAGLRFVAGFLFNVEVWSFPVIGIASLIVAAAGLLSCALPLAQVLRISPVSAFRAD